MFTIATLWTILFETGAFNYGYEYMGLNGRLVITPLTDRIYLTITQALSMHLGGAPAGPAGTGKTETVKDLAKAMGLLCVVTNCGENMDNVAVGRVLSGLSQCGAWGCFDEFNRIDLSVLSVVSTQLHSIRNALILGLKRFMFEGKEIVLEPTVGVFITMNPGYAGRTELPESVKALFRPAVCVVPDLEMICLIMLFSEGFLKAKMLARKMTVLYKLSQQQLSRQYHYDFGLRALKSVLATAGALKRGAPDLPEDVVLMRALRDMNLPKMVFEDGPLFLRLIADLFPGLSCPRVSHEDIALAAEQAITEMNLEIIPTQVDKVVQVYETMLTRHSTMVIGPAAGGKTVIFKGLAKAQGIIGLPTKLYILNPKAVTVMELYGVLDPTTRDWTDGLLSSIFREINKPTEKKERRYLLFDGDVDALWIENMNSVMDDNKLLTLSNGERVRLLNHCALLFEVGDLSYASPATVSRAGMVYVDPRELGCNPLWDCWIKTRSEEENDQLSGAFERVGFPAIKLAVTKCKSIVPQSEINMVIHLCSVLDATLPKKSPPKLIPYFNQALMWSVGASLLLDSRAQIAEFIKMNSGAGMTPSSPYSLEDCTWSSEKQQWEPWKDRVPEYVHNPNVKFVDILVPTVDTAKIEWVLNLSTKIQRPVILVGETGASKTATTNSFLRELDSETHIILSLSFSSRTTSMDLQRSVESHVEKRTKDVYGPPPGRRLIVFIDDLNLPMVDQYGTQQPIALLRLLLERGGLYGRGKDLLWKNLKDMGYIFSMGPPGGGRNPIDPRLLSHVSVVHVAPPETETLNRILTSILAGHLQVFSTELQEIVPDIVKATLQLYQILLKEFPPTPAKFHYIFSPRDLSRIWAGMTLISPERFSRVDQLCRVWRHEVYRTVFDRLINEEDQEKFKGFVHELVDRFFPLHLEVVERDPILFGDFRNALLEDEPRLYEDLQDYDAVQALFQEILEEYCESQGRLLKLVLFEDALEHLVRVHRLLRMNRGHALLVGIAGSGKQSLTRLAAFTAGCEIFEITVGRGYTMNSFREDLKSLFSRAGVDNKAIVFLLTDSQLVDEGFLEQVNSVLTSGTPPSLFTDEDRDQLIQDLKDEVEKQGLPATRDVIWHFFANRCCANVHVVLALSPAGDTLRTRCRYFPGLINNTCIDWYQPWPTQALIAVASVFLAESDKIPDDYRSDLVAHMVHVHQTVTAYSKDFRRTLRRENHVTPKHYLDYLKVYIELLAERDLYIHLQCERLSGGLERIADASIQLADLNAKLAVQRIAVAEKTAKCEQLLAEIQAAQQEATSKKNSAMKKKEEVREQNIVISAEKKEAEAVLVLAMPALEAARLALSDLEKSDITEIRSFATPPRAVQVITECILILRGSKEINWKASKAMMSDPSFLQQLKDLDVDNISWRAVNAVKAHLREIEVNLEGMKAISRAGAGLMKFVEAVIGYCAVFRDVKPKRDRVIQLELEYERAKAEAEFLTREVDRVEKLMIDLNARLELALEERQKLQEETDIMERRAAAADKLISGLGSERDRWQIELAELRLKRTHLVGNCLLASSFLCYCGAFSFEFRQQMLLDDWFLNIVERGVPVTDPYKIPALLTTELEINKWSREGLPPDELSVQNGILTTRAPRFPLCIDPQQQAARWLLKREVNNNVKEVMHGDSDMLKQMELAVKFGFPVVLRDIEETVDPSLDNVLARNIQTDSGRQFVMLGDREVDFDPNFRMYLVTKMSNPKFSPNIFAKVIVINYSLTLNGLEDQLLSAVVRCERPDLEEQREALTRETSQNKDYLKALEDSLLRELATCEGNMLDNTELLQTLDETKNKAFEVSEKLQLAATTTHDLDRLRDGYRPVARRGALLFFALSDLSAVSPMYQYSLDAFMEVFRRAMKKSMPDPTLAKRLTNVIETLTMYVYNYGCTGIFERHKLLFSFLMAVRLQLDGQKLNAADLDYFIRGNVRLKPSGKPCPYDFFPQKTWDDILSLAEDFPEYFSTLPEDIKDNEVLWKQWYESDIPEKLPVPVRDSEEMVRFHLLMLLRCVRVDRVIRSASDYVSVIMGENFIKPPVVSLEAVLEQSSSTTPIIFLLSAGSDPTDDLLKLADRSQIGSARVKVLSLGQGQQKIAIELLETATTRGHWLLLQNCHLLLDFVRALERKLESMGKPHPDFRLWMTTDPSPKFPVGLLQRSLKVVTEPPSGIHMNMRATYTKLRPTTLEACLHVSFKSLVYALGFFHAVVIERRKYAKLGWNVGYEFNDADFTVCVQILNTYLDKSGDSHIPWNSLKYLCGEVMYGGRVTDDFDRRIVRTYMDEYLGDFLFDAFQPFSFFRGPEFEYVIPEDGTHDTYLDHIKTYPLSDSPEILGLHANAEIDYFTNAARDLWAQLYELQPQSAGAGGEEAHDELVAGVADEILASMPEHLEKDADSIPQAGKAYHPPNPYKVVLNQELDHYNSLLDCMQRTLITLKKALKGEAALDAELEDVSRALSNGQLPGAWRKRAPDTLLPLAAWLKHLKLRASQYIAWKAVQDDMQTIWLSGLHVPEAFITALIQTTSRNEGWPLDRTILTTQISKIHSSDMALNRPSGGCAVTGLFLEGASWDWSNGCLARQKPKVLREEMPPVALVPKEKHKVKHQNALKTPVYITPARRNAMGVGLVLEVELRTEDHHSHWILQGVCLTLNTD